MSVALRYNLTALASLKQRVERLGAIDRRGLLEQLGGVVEAQTVRRIREEKEAPDGSAWPEWSEPYARRRHGGHSLLEGEGDLATSIHFALQGNDTVVIGSNLIYAATHQEGDSRRNIPARPYLGLSADNEAELEATVDAWLEAVLP